MKEKVITIYDTNECKIKALVILNKKITILGEQKLINELQAYMERFENLGNVTLKLKEMLATRHRKRSTTDNLVCLEPFVLESKNRNKSSRYKHMLRKMNLSHFERVDIKYDRKKNI